MDKTHGTTKTTHRNTNATINGRHVSPNKQESTTLSWADKVRVTDSTMRHTLEPLPQQPAGSRLTIPPGMAMHSTDQWARCMIGFFTGYKPPFRAVNLIATKAWKQYGLEQVMTMATGFYIFRFTGEEAVQEVIEKGPWMFGGKNIILQKWTPSFHFNRNKIPTISVWVRLRGLPLPLWTKQGLSMAASMVGKPLSCDEQTMGCRRLEFARLCVELDAALPFVHHFEVESPLTEEPQRVEVEYEWKPPRCESCRSFGHNCERKEKQETAAHHDEELPSEPPSSHLPPSSHPHTLTVQLCKGEEPNPNRVVKNHNGPSRLDKGKQVQLSNTGTQMEDRLKESRVEVHPNPPQTSSNHNPSITDREGQIRTTNRMVPQLSQSESTSNTALSTMHRQEDQSKGNSHSTGHKEGLQGNQQSSLTGASSSEKKVKGKKKEKKNPFFGDDYAVTNGSGNADKLWVLKEPTGRDLLARYDLGRELGRGEFGVTYLCTDINTGEKFACKSISKKKLRTAVDIEDVRREVEIMKHLPAHPNIVSLKASYEDDSAVHIVMELCEGGELFDRIVARGHYTERAAAAVMRTIVEVVQMCHRHGVMHRNLKPENFLFANKKETSALKAIDFGLSVFFKPGERFNEIVGSPYYMAPEVLKRNYGPEVDVWSAGVILYILLCGVPPFWAETEQGVAQAIIRSVIDFKRDPWPRVSDNAKDLVMKMLNPDPKLRLTAQQVLEHPWIQNAKKAPNVPLGETVRARLKQFSVMNKLKKRALRVIAEHLSVEEAAGIKEAFDLMDTGKKGSINLEELRVGLQKLGQLIADADLQILMEAADVDGDGALNYGEFVAISVHIKKMGNDEHLHKAFAFFDRNQSGYIEIEELRESLNDDIDTSSEDVINAIMHDVDTDKDGRISYEEFATMMKAGTDWRKASRQYSRERFNNLSITLRRDGSLHVAS